MYQYYLKAMMDFTDIHDETVKYKKNQPIVVDEERAFELFSSNYHLVKFIKREEIEDASNITQQNINNITPEDSQNSQTNFNDGYESLNFLELKKIAEDKKMNVSGINKKKDLIKLLRENN